MPTTIRPLDNCWPSENGRFEQEKKGKMTQSYDKRPYSHRQIQKALWQHKNATTNFDYYRIVDRLRTVSYIGKR